MVLVTDAAPLDRAAGGPQVVYVNPAFTRMTGYESSDIVGLTPRLLQSPKTDRGEPDRLRAALLAWEPVEAELLNVRKDGSEFWVQINITPVADADGNSTHWVAIQRDITSRAVHQLQLRHQALHDSLTGLPNRALLLDRLEQAQQRDPGRGVAVLYLDLERFKAVNDLHGHHIGDAVLVEVAQRLRGAVRPDDPVARLAGDEFVVLCVDVTLEQAKAGAERLAAVLAQTFHLAGVSTSMKASVGVAYSPPGRGGAEDLLRDGDVAMYAAKNLGRGQVVVFDEELGLRVRGRFQLETQLRHALGADELVLHYQPQVNLTDRSLTGLEALVRWQHPSRGLLAPAAFLDLAGEVGLLGELGEWVLNRALRDAARRWRAGARVPLWINVSAPELEDPVYAATVAEKLRAHQLPGSALGIEMTEDVIIHDVGRARNTLLALRALGVHLAVDDFGIGYSSLSYLAHFPVDVVKVDRTFITGIDDHEPRRESFAIVGAVVGLARALDLSVLAEGIETTTQAQALHGLGCDSGQGYLFGKPLPLDEQHAELT